MIERNDALIQTASGLWIPKQTRVQREQYAQQPQQKVQQAPEPARDWEAHWKAQGQSWRREPEIDQERQQFLRQRLEIEIDEAQNIHPFQYIVLKRNDLEWLIQKRKEKSVSDEEQPQELNLQKAIFGTIDCKYLPLEGANFGDAELEGANFESAKLEDANFEFAKLEDATFWYAELKGADFESANLEGANFEFAKLEDANFRFAHLEGANFWHAELKGANFGSAELKGANFEDAKLEGADFWDAELKGADFGSAKLEDANFEDAKLEGANFRSAKLEGANFRSAIVVTTQGIGPMVADVTGWDERSLPLREWSAVKRLGDEAKAKKRRDFQGKVKDATTRFDEYFAATRAYQQVATAVEGMGPKKKLRSLRFVRK